MLYSYMWSPSRMTSRIASYGYALRMRYVLAIMLTHVLYVIKINLKFIVKGYRKKIIAT